MIQTNIDELSPEVYRSNAYPKSVKPLALLQEYAARAYISLFGVWAAILYVLIARHLPLLWYGIIGLFTILLISNLFGAAKAQAQFVEIGFREGFFYVASVYDIAFKRKIEYYPLNFANISLEGNKIHFNYKGRIIVLHSEEWNNSEELISRFLYRPPQMPFNVDIT